MTTVSKDEVSQSEIMIGIRNVLSGVQQDSRKHGFAFF